MVTNVAIRVSNLRIVLEREEALKETAFPLFPLFFTNPLPLSPMRVCVLYSRRPIYHWGLVNLGRRSGNVEGGREGGRYQRHDFFSFFSCPLFSANKKFCLFLPPSGIWKRRLFIKSFPPSSLRSFIVSFLLYNRKGKRFLFGFVVVLCALFCFEFTSTIERNGNTIKRHYDLTKAQSLFGLLIPF